MLILNAELEKQNRQTPKSTENKDLLQQTALYKVSASNNKKYY